MILEAYKYSLFQEFILYLHPKNETMNTHNFNLKEDQEYIQLNNLLQYLSIAQTGGHAKILIQNEEVFLNDAIETRIRKKVFSGDVVTLENVEVFVK